jgi:hypothetical protein
MKRMACGTAAALALVGLAACFSNPANDLNTDNFHIVQATPQVAFTKVGDSIQLRLRLVNDVLNGAVTSFTVSNVGAGISVRYDDKFRPYYTDGDTLTVPVDKDMQQYYVKGLTAGKWTFTVAATANPSAPAATVTITVEPKTVSINKFTNLVAGDTVTLTTTPGSVFSQTSAVSFATAGVIGIASRSADSTQIKVVVGPGTAGIATVTKVGTLGNVAVGTASVPTDNAINTIPALSLGNALGTTTGLAAGNPIVITAPAGMVFSQTSAVTFTTGTVGIASRSADSTTITVLAGPGLSGAATVTKVGLIKGAVLGTFTLTSTNSVSPAVANVTVAPTTLSTAAPAFGASMTVQLGGSLRFLAGSKILIGGRQGYITSVSADSSTATFTPIGGSNGTVTYTGIALSFLNTVALNVTGDKTAIVGAATSDPNAGSIATASTFALPAVGATVVLSDGGPFTAGGPCALAGGNGCRYYKIVTTATNTLALELRWDNGTTTDLGAYLINAAGTALGSAGAADAQPNQAGGPETGTWSALPAGTYYIAIVWYNSGPQPPYFHLGIKRTS